MSKIDELKQWIEDEICRLGQLEKFVKVVDESGEGDGRKGIYELRFKFRIYTETHSYGITAIDRSKEEGYLGCVASARKPLAGEDSTRGSDLPDGKFTRETWEKIKNAIIAYELLKLAPKVNPRTQEVEAEPEAAKT